MSKTPSETATTPREDEALLPLPRAAKRLSISLRTMKALVASGAIPIVRVSPGRVAIDPRDLQEYVRSRRSAP